MNKFVRLHTSNGDEVRVALEHWGAGVDQAFRRWVLREDRWHCLETGETAQKARRLRLKIFGSSRPHVIFAKH